MRRHLRTFTVLSLIAGLLAWGAGPASARSGRLILHRHAIPGRYIVVLRSSVPRAPAFVAAGMQRAYGARVQRVFTDALDGFVADMSRAQALRTSRDPRVAYVEQDAVVRLSQTQTAGDLGPRPDRPARACPSTARTRTPATGSGVTAYVIDTGIRFTHQEFGGRAISGFDAIDGRERRRLPRPRHARRRHDRRHRRTASPSRSASSRSGSSTARARAARRRSSRGIDWVTAGSRPGRARRREHEPRRHRPRRGDGPGACRASIADGVTYAIAAGNGNIFGFAANACNSSPARVAAALTVERHGRDRHARPRGPTSAPAWTSSRRASRITSAWGIGRHRHQHDQRHVDGHAARRGRGGHVPGDEPDRHTRPGRLDDHLERDAGGREEPGERLAQPPALLGPHDRAPATATSATRRPHRRRLRRLPSRAPSP